MTLQPSSNAVGLAVRQEIHPPTAFEVDQHSAIALTFAKGPIIDADHTGRRATWLRRAAHQPQEGVGTGGHGQSCGLSGPGLTAQGQSKLPLRLGQLRGSSGARGRESGQAFGEGPPCTVGVVTEETAHLHSQLHLALGPG